MAQECPKSVVCDHYLGNWNHNSRQNWLHTEWVIFQKRVDFEPWMTENGVIGGFRASVISSIYNFPLCDFMHSLMLCCQLGPYGPTAVKFKSQYKNNFFHGISCENIMKSLQPYFKIRHPRFNLQLPDLQINYSDFIYTQGTRTSIH